MMEEDITLICDLKRSGALWVHDGNPLRPHVVLTGGRHSDRYFNGRVVEENPILLDLVASEMVARADEAGVNIEEIDRVVGPAMGAIELAHSVARNIHRVRGKLCLSSYTEKEQDKMVFRTSYVLPGENVLVVEDTITTGGSVGRVVDAVLAKGGAPLPFLPVISNQTGCHDVRGMKILSVVERKIETWTPEECPLCKVGSEALRPPKAWSNWQRLTAEY
jgi:orotate phosphoribosyltransferase